MSLQDEIAKDLFDFETNGKIYTFAAKEIINKVLDAAAETIKSGLEEQLSCRAKVFSYGEVIDDVVVEINKLRPKS